MCPVDRVDPQSHEGTALHSFFLQFDEARYLVSSAKGGSSMAIFRSPGLADEDVASEVIDAWNRRILDEVNRHRPSSPFLVLDPSGIPDGEISSAVKWSGHPLEPLQCTDEETAEKLSDYGWAGRAELHNEYLEYGFVTALDANGVERPKRLIATTELMEWWQTLAVHDAPSFLSKVEQIIGIRYSMSELFERDMDAWESLAVPVRERLFRLYIVGSGRNSPPRHSLNQASVLFMGHQINGLDDLIYVVHFGAFPYAVMANNVTRRARIEEIFHWANAAYLYCRNADPAAAVGAYNQAFLQGTEGSPAARSIAFSDPLGMYIRTFSTGDLFYDGTPAPDDWTVLTRGHENDTPQRLEFGPPNSHPGFLDDIKVGSEDDAPIVTGFQLAKRIEVGPQVVVGGERPIQENEFIDILAADPGTIECGQASNRRCRDIDIFRREVEAQEALIFGTRGGRGA